jgi:hypothetical protein
MKWAATRAEYGEHIGARDDTDERWKALAPRGLSFL